MKQIALSGLVGVVFGFAMSRIGFTSWDQVHGMFTFTAFSLLLAFMTAVMVLALSWFLVGRFTAAKWGKRGLHKGTIAGGVLFGVGWAVSGACPTIALAQVGEGQLAALVTIAGVLAGNWLYAYAHPRWFRWPTSSCVDD